MVSRPWRLFMACLFMSMVGLAGTVSYAQTNEPDIVEQLRQGGYHIYFRHAATDWSGQDRVAAAGDWRSCDPANMRQLSDDGRQTARAIGRAIAALRIPIGRILSSEYCRSADTARLMGLGDVEPTRDIMNMRAAAFVGGPQAVVDRARAILSTLPKRGNTIIVGHGNLMRAATGEYAGEGGAAVFLPDADSETGFRLVASLSPANWQKLAAFD